MRTSLSIQVIIAHAKRTQMYRVIQRNRLLDIGHDFRPLLSRLCLFAANRSIKTIILFRENATEKKWGAGGGSGTAKQTSHRHCNL